MNTWGTEDFEGNKTVWHNTVALGTCHYACMCAHVQLSVISYTVAHQAPLSLELSRQEYWSGLPFPSQPRDRNCVSYGSCISGGFFIIEPPGKPIYKPKPLF